MYEKEGIGRLLRLSALAVLVTMANQLWAADNVPSMGGDEESAMHTDVTYENHTAVRQYTGLSKFRNTLQAESDKQLSDGWALHSILRGSWDGVYQLNASHYGKTAGGSILLGNAMGNSTNGLPNQVPQGEGIVNWYTAQHNSDPTKDLPPSNLFFGTNPNPFLNFYPNNPNSGLVVLGESTYGPTPTGDVAFGVPVRPCDTDSRGCRNFGGYGNLTQAQLASPEFDDHLDFIRELYVKKNVALDDGKEMFVKLGRQQVVWGRTDLFRVLDVLNPVDYSRNNIYDELSDIRIPMFMLQTEYRMGPSDSMQDRNLQLVWNFDKFRPNDLGQCGTPNVILDAGCFFRGMANLWDNGGTVANFAGGNTATNFGPNQIGIRNVDLPGWSLSNTQLGAKFEGVSSGGLSFSVNALTYRSQLPSLHSINGAAFNPFVGGHGNIPGAGGVVPPVSSLIAFDMEFPRVNLIGGSMDFQVPSAQAAIRMEGALTKGEEFANTARSGLYSANNVFRSVIGVDRPTFIPFISETSATLISTQVFYQHIFNHELHQGPLGQVGMPDWENDFIMTMLVRGTLKNGMFNPQVIFARDFQATANVIAPQLEWNVSTTMKLTFGANYKFWSGSSNYRFDDCRSCNPYPPFTAAPGQQPGQSAGLSSVEPLGIFRAGPIGAAFNQNDLYFKLNYKF